MPKKYHLTDNQWKKIEHLLPGRKDTPGGTGKNNRQFVNAVLWVLNTGAPWRSLPPAYGKWNSVFQRFNRWQKSGVWEKIFCHLCQAADHRSFSIDSTIVRCHQHSSGAKGSVKKKKRSVVREAV